MDYGFLIKIEKFESGGMGMPTLKLTPEELEFLDICFDRGIKTIPLEEIPDNSNIASKILAQIRKLKIERKHYGFRKDYRSK